MLITIHIYIYLKWSYNTSISNKREKGQESVLFVAREFFALIGDYNCFKSEIFAHTSSGMEITHDFILYSSP